jgi:MFS transporter, DHA2 family, multidrug resistance protein
VVVVAVMLAVLLQLADTTIVNVSLPTIDGALGVSADEGTWLITSYIIANVIVIPLSPWLQARFGRRSYFVASIAGFTLFSALCGMANSLGSEIVMRFAQGAFGGGLMIPAQQILRDTYPPKDLGKSQALFGLAVPIGPTIGPILGGYLTDNLSWQWIFFVNVLPGIVACALVLWILRDPEPPKKLRVDAIGIALLAVGLGSLQYVLERGERLDWWSDSGIVLFTVLAAAGSAAFVWWELRGTKTPAVDLRVMQQRPVWASTLTFFCLGFAFYGMFLLQPLYTQQTMQLTTSLSGQFMMLRALAVMAMFPVVNWLVGKPKIDMRVVVAVSTALYAVTWWWQAQLMTSTADFDAFVVSQIAGGIVLGLAYMPFNVVVMRAVDPAAVGPSLALVRLGMQIGGSVGSAAIITFISRVYASHATALQDGMTMGRETVRTFVAQHGPHASAALSALVGGQATVLAEADAARLLGVILLLCAPLPLLVRKHRPREAQPSHIVLPSRPTTGGAENAA